MNVDTLLLAQFAVQGRPKARRVVDLGAGVGALALAYAFLGSAGHVDLVERDETLVQLSRENLRLAGIAGATHVTDLGQTGLPSALRAQADVVLSNPPFFPERAGTAAAAAKRGARSGSLFPFTAAAASALGRRGYAYFAYPAPALDALFDAARGVQLVPKRLRLVHAFANSAARLVLVEMRRAKPGGLVIEPPLVEWAARGERSAELQALLEAKRRAGDRA